MYLHSATLLRSTIRDLPSRFGNPDHPSILIFIYSKHESSVPLFNSEEGMSWRDTLNVTAPGYNVTCEALFVTPMPDIAGIGVLHSPNSVSYYRFVYQYTFKHLSR